MYINQCAGKRTFATPKPPNPTITPKPSFFQKTLVQNFQNVKKPGVITVNIYIPSSHKSAKIAIFRCQKTVFLKNRNLILT